MRLITQPSYGPLIRWEQLEMTCTVLEFHEDTVEVHMPHSIQQGSLTSSLKATKSFFPISFYFKVADQFRSRYWQTLINLDDCFNKYFNPVEFIQQDFSAQNVLM